MAVTQAQIENALTYTALFKIFQPSAPVNSISIADATNWIAIGVDTGAGDTIEYLYKITDPAGVPVYENNGFAGGDFSSPDTDTLNNILLNVTSGGKPVQGNYVVQVKVKVTVLGDPAVYGAKTFEFALAKSVTCINAKVSITFNCTTAVATSTDTTNYAAAGYNIISKTRVHTLYPPETSGQTPTIGTGEIVTHADLLAPAPYESEFTMDVVYRTADNLVTVNAHFEAETFATSACDDVLCKMFCCLKKLEDNYQGFVRNPTKQEPAWQLLLKGMTYYGLAVAARRCGNETKVTAYAAQFYSVTKCDPNCDCCDDTAPVIPAGPCECTDGTDGREVEMQKTGSWVQWRYAGDVAWTNLYDVSAYAGPPGEDGVGSLLNSNTDSVTTTDDWEAWAAKTCSLDHTVDGKNLVNVGDRLEVYARFKVSSPNSTTPQKVRLTLNGSVQLLGIFEPSFFEYNVIEIYSTISKLTNTTCSVISRWYYGLDSGALSAIDINEAFVTRKFTLALTDTASTDNYISAQANDLGGDAVTCEAMYVDIYKYTSGTQSPQTNIKYMVPFTTTNGVTVYPNVIGSIGKNMLRVYLDGELLNSSDWSYDSLTDTLTFNIAITGASEVAGDYL